MNHPPEFVASSFAVGFDLAHSEQVLIAGTDRAPIVMALGLHLLVDHGGD